MTLFRIFTVLAFAWSVVIAAPNVLVVMTDDQGSHTAELLFVLSTLTTARSTSQFDVGDAECELTHWQQWGYISKALLHDRSVLSIADKLFYRTCCP